MTVSPTASLFAPAHRVSLHLTVFCPLLQHHPGHTPFVGAIEFVLCAPLSVTAAFRIREIPTVLKLLLKHH